jgi:hypothetical protein
VEVTGSSTREERDRELLKRAVDVDSDQTGATSTAAEGTSGEEGSAGGRKAKLTLSKRPKFG